MTYRDAIHRDYLFIQPVSAISADAWQAVHTVLLHLEEDKPWRP